MTAKQVGKVLVLGATGSQGGAVARHLVEPGFSDVHALVRTAGTDRARQLAEWLRGAFPRLETFAAWLGRHSADVMPQG